MVLSPITQVAVAVVLHDQCVLIGPRPAGSPLAGSWEFPGGKLVQGELPAEAAARECLEETGLWLASLQPWEIVEFDYPHGPLKLHFFRGQLARQPSESPLPESPLPESPLPESPLPAPRQPFRWVPVVDLPRYSFPPANGVVLAQLAAGVSPAKTV